ncbi:hypothetical protein H8S20_04135 [Clostridium sp. NSJ-6]|uniref:Uncharacterized protein n=1 Tax=Clostridium hominis TaxID=2763036 RepID=A0ABR7D9Q7_9CLOT|nr:hypothetical protein [Clostridium hominis]MBC5628078.1 hypothetical protein [Clostridium hominis]
MAIGDLEDNFNWYLFDINGYSETGWQSKNNKWYYYDNITADIEREIWQNNGVEVIANENEWNIY